MGNGEQYIWKPPEDDDIVPSLPSMPHGESGQSQSNAVEVRIGRSGGRDNWIVLIAVTFYLTALTIDHAEPFSPFWPNALSFTGQLVFD